MPKRRGAGFYIFRLLNILQRSDLVPEGLRRRLLRLAGVKVGQARIVDGVHFTCGEIVIEDGSFIAQQVLVEAYASIKIGRNVHIAHRCNLITVSHKFGPSERRAGDTVTAPIVIEDGCWLGAAVTILPGVTVAKGCIIAAGSVVTKDTDADGLYAGVPATRKKSL